MSITDIRPAELVEDRGDYTVSVWLVVAKKETGLEVGRTNRPELIDAVIEELDSRTLTAA
jgi:hypothetical protein